MKVLFVDDEPRVLEGIERSLRVAVDWDATFVTSGEAALEVLAREAHDVVVSDMRMPGMDGVTLLQLVCERHPGVVRIVLSGQADENSGLRVARVAHQFLAKPCDARTVRRVVEKTGELQRLLSDPQLRALVGGVTRLPSSIRIFQDLSQLLDSEDASIDSVIELVRQDPAMSSKLLQFVNSSFFAHSRETTDIKTAVLRLGMKTVRSLTLAIGVFDTGATAQLPGGLTIDDFQRRAFETARIASGSVVEPKEADAAFMAGLICDVGELVMASKAPARLAEAWANAESRQQSRSEAERELWGVGHAQIGACLLGIWGLPFQVVEAVAHHHTPESTAQAGVGLAAVVWVASSVAAGTEPDPELIRVLGAETLLARARQVAQKA